MARASGIRAGRAFVELLVDDDGISKGLRKVQAKLKSFGSEIQRIGQGFLFGGAAAGLPFGLSARAFGEFEQSMALVLAVTGANREEFARLNAEAERLGKTTVFTATQAADAMGFFARAGFQVNDILNAIGPALDLAAAGQIDVAQAADIATQVLKQFNIDASESKRVMDVLAKASTSANTTIPQLGDAFQYAGTLSNIAGVQFEEVAAAIQVLSDAGIQGELAGTSLRGILTTIAAPSAAAQKAIDELGISFSDSAGNIRPLAEIISQFEHQLKGLGKFEQLEILSKIFPNRQVAAVAGSLTRGSQALADMTEELYNADGAASEMANIQLNTLQGSVTLLTSAINGLGITVGKKLAPYLRVAIEFAIRGVRWFEEFARTNQRLIWITAGVATGLTVLGATLVTVGIAAKVVAFTIGGVVTAFSLLKGVITGALFLFGAITSPITLMIGTVAALGVAILYYSKAGQDAIRWLGAQFAGLMKQATPAINAIRDALMAKDIPLAADILWAGLELAWATGVDKLSEIWEGVMLSMREAFAKTSAWIQTQWALLVTGTGNIVDSVVSGTSGLINKGLNATGLISDDQYSQMEDIRKQDREQQRLDRANKLLDGLETIDTSLDDDLVRIRKESEEKTGRRVEEASERIKRLQQDLRALIAEASALREEQKAEREKRKANPLDPESLLNELIGGGSKVGVRGTFGGSRAALASLGSQSPLLKPVQEINKNTKKIAESYDYGGSRFA